MSKNGGVSPKQRAFIEHYLMCWNASEAARLAGYRGKANVIGPRLLANVSIQAAIQARVDEMAMSANEIMLGLSAQARGDLGLFFKLVEEWTFYPLPTYDILGAKEVVDDTDPEKPVKRVSYWVRHVALDMDKVIDPKYSHLLHKFSDSPRDGLGIEIYNKQTALQTLAKIRGMIVAKSELTGKDGGPIETKSDGLTDDERLTRIVALLERARARRDRQSPGESA